MKLYVMLILLVLSVKSFSQYPSNCPGVNSRTNGNGQSNLCPNVNGTLYAVNFIGTSYATVPASAKTGTIVFRYANALASLTPFAITKVYSTNPTTTLLPVQIGPASLPVVSGLDVLVTYCFYGMNLPTAGVLSFEMTNPTTGVATRICSFDANCISGCASVANPAGLTLPVTLKSFTVRSFDEMVSVDWSTDQENNNKGFFVERSIDGIDFSSLGFVASKNGNGNSSVTTTYKFTDLQPVSNAKSFYRLRQVDLDGKESLSAIADLVAIRKNKIIVSQQAGAIHVLINDQSGNHQAINIYRADGSLVVNKKLNGHNRFVSNRLIPGNYYVQILDAQGAKNSYPVVVY